MKLSLIKNSCLALVFIFTVQVGFSQDYRSPKGFEKSIVKFEEEDKKEMPPEGAIVATGSSSIRMWHPRIKKDLAPLTIIPRGFGGSNMNDLLHYADRIVLKYKPRAVMIYEGDNDTGQGISTEKILEKFKQLKAKLEKANPKIRIYFISIKPSIKRWKMWPAMVKTNNEFKEICDKNENCFYIDTASFLLKDGKPNPDFFIKDKLHLNQKGYDAWQEAVKKVLHKTELTYEK